MSQGHAAAALPWRGGDDDAIDQPLVITPICTVARSDRRGIYADGTGYSACLDDAQLQAQVNSTGPGPSATPDRAQYHAGQPITPHW
jgi:hypothetical protein